MTSSIPEVAVEAGAAALHDTIQPGEFTCGDLAKAVLEAVGYAEMVARITLLEATVQNYRDGAIEAFDALCPICRGAASLSDDLRAALSSGSPPISPTEGRASALSADELNPPFLTRDKGPAGDG